MVIIAILLIVIIAILLMVIIAILLMVIIAILLIVIIARFSHGAAITLDGRRLVSLTLNPKP